MKAFLDRLHAKLGDLWWYSLMIFIACRSGDVIQAFIGLWLVPKYVGQEELGAVLPLQQLSGLFAVPLAILATVFAKYVNTYATRGEYGKVKSFIRDVLLATCCVFLVCIGVAYLVVPHFYERLNIQAGLLTVLILAAGFATNLASIFTAALQGLKKFKTMTVQNLISAPIRLVTLLVAMPFRALSGYILGQATPPASCSLLAAGSLYKDLKTIPMDTSWRKDLPEIWRYLWPVAIYTGIGTVTGAIFITVIRQRLPEVESAAFYILSRLSEIAGYAAGTMAVVLFPLASEAHEKGENTTGILKRTAVLSIAATLVLSGIFTLIAPVIFAHVSAWSQYGEYAYLLPPMTIFAGFAALISAFIAYEVACRHFITLAFIHGLNVIITALLVAFTGCEFFRGLLPNAMVDWMASLPIARLQTIVYLFTAWNVIQIPIFYLCDRLFYPKAITRRR